MEEAEISWIAQSDVHAGARTRIRGCEELGIRGGSGPALGPRAARAPADALAFESGGLPGEVVRGVAASDLPALEYLELWLGVAEYGGDATVADLAPLLTGGRLPALRHLGLRNSEIQDEIAGAVARRPVVARLSSLDLSLGALGDEGAAALLAGQPLTHLSWLDLHHNFVGAAPARRLRRRAGAGRCRARPDEPGEEDECGTASPPLHRRRGVSRPVPGAGPSGAMSG